jgi:predicted acetyltransferase
MVAHESNTQGIGIMYRVINMPALFKALKIHNFNGGTINLKITISDSFFKKNAGSYFVKFNNGRAELRKGGRFEAEIKLDISDFSSLIMGAIDFRSLYQYGLAGISDTKYLVAVNRIFLTESRPVCMTEF